VTNRSGEEGTGQSQLYGLLLDRLGGLGRKVLSVEALSSRPFLRVKQDELRASRV
jgi:hypothetical protein